MHIFPMTEYLDNLLGATALSLTDLMEADAERILGLGGQAAGALVLLALRPRMNIKRLGERLRLTHPGAVRLAERLEQAGWVARESGEDRRTVRLSLTREGEAQVERLREARAARLASLTAPLSAAERAALEPILTTLLKRLTVDLVSAYANCRLCDTPLCERVGCPVDAQARSLPEAQVSPPSP